jgi:hypothetical protein
VSPVHSAHRNLLGAVLTRAVALNHEKVFLEAVSSYPVLGLVAMSAAKDARYEDLQLRSRLQYQLKVRAYMQVEEKFNDMIYFLPLMKVPSRNAFILSDGFSKELDSLSEFEARKMLLFTSYEKVRRKLAFEQYWVFLTRVTETMYNKFGESIYEWPEYAELVKEDLNFKKVLLKSTSPLKVKKSAGFCRRALGWMNK